MLKLKRLGANDGLLALGLFLVAFMPRLLILDQFITGDEPRWVVRSMAFLTGLLTADWQATLQTGHPGVTTMWSGSLGLILSYLFSYPTDASLLEFIQSLPPNYERIEPAILPWMRLPVVISTSISVAALFLLLKSVDRTVAIVAALLLALHPIYLGNSQLLHHDALVSVFIILSVIPFLLALRTWSWTWLVFSGVMTGLALLSKSTAYALFPFVGVVVLFELLRKRLALKQAVGGMLVWGISGLLTVFVLWPALWVDPLAVGQTVFGWVNESAEVADVSNTLIPHFGKAFPDLGIFFYPINWLLKSTPLTMLGLIFFFYWWKKEPAESTKRWWALCLLLWIGLFSLMLSLGDKRDGRYLLPIYFAVCILAALGLKTIYQNLSAYRLLTLKTDTIQINILLVAFILGLVGFGPAYAPYYLAYYNPLIGGPWLAPHLVKVGLGDGMEQAAAWLNSQPEADRLQVATDLPQTIAPFFVGQTIHHNTDSTFSADYVLNYRRQIQGGVPFGEYWQYYQARPPAFKVRLAGIDHLWLHKEPPLATVGRIDFGDDLILRAYTTNQPIGTPGQPLHVTLIWRTDSLHDKLVQLQLRDKIGQVRAESGPAPVIDPDGPSSVEGHSTLDLPDTLSRGSYALWAAIDNEQWHQFAPIPVGYTEPPEPITQPVNVNFANQIMLRGFEMKKPLPGEPLTLKLHWQTLYSIPTSYTTFIHILDSSGNVIAQSDTLPGQGQWLTNTWQPGEWITDHISLALPATLPADEYQILVGWYHLESGQRLPIVTDNTQSAAVLDVITVP